MIYTRTYTPTADHFTRCSLCGGWSVPFPHEVSLCCSICYYEVERVFRLAESPHAKDAPTCAT